MSEEIINNEQGTNNEVQNPETPIQEQEQNNTEEQTEQKSGATQVEEKQKEEKPTVKYVKIGREMKPKVTLYNADACNALAHEVA